MLNPIYTLFLVLLGIIILFIHIFIISRYCKIIIFKGYNPYNIYILTFFYEIIIVIFFGIIFTLFLSAFTIYHLNIENVYKQSLVFSIWILIWFIFTLLLYIFISTKVKVKEPKIFGKRIVPFIYKVAIFTIPLLIILSMCMFFDTIFYSDEDWVRKGSIFCTTISGFISLIYLFNSLIQKIQLFLNQKSLTDIKNITFNVLYLRSFYLDSLPFESVDVKNKTEFGDLIAFNTQSSKAFIKFEEFFGYQIISNIGNMVCLGNPLNNIPMEGVIDLYPKVYEWQELLSNLMNDSKIILMQIGSSQHIPYELEEIIKTNNLNKLCIITEPSFGNIQNKRLNKKIIDWYHFYQHLSPSQLTNILINAGLKINFPLVGGSVIVFDSNRTGNVLIKNCKMPSEYVLAIKNYFG